MKNTKTYTFGVDFSKANVSLGCVYIFQNIRINHAVSENSSYRFPYTKLRGMFLGSFGRRWQSGCLAMAPGRSMALSAFSEETSPWKDQYMYLSNNNINIGIYNKRCYSKKWYTSTHRRAHTLTQRTDPCLVPFPETFYSHKSRRKALCRSNCRCYAPHSEA